MSVLEAGEADRSTMSPLDEVVSPTSVVSELMVTDMLDEHETTLNEHRDGKRKRDTDGEELTPRKLPSLTRNNNDVGFVLEESADDDLHEDRDDVSSTRFYPSPTSGPPLFPGRITRFYEDRFSSSISRFVLSTGDRKGVGLSRREPA